MNYLPAVDARIKVEADVALNSLNLNQLLERLDEAKAGVRLLLVDACRDNPYTRGFRSTARGLARVEGAPSGTLMHFATKPGGVADDGNGANGLYTTYLLRHVRTPGLAVESMLKRVASDVRAASGGSQQPWTEGALDGEFYFAGLATPPIAMSAQPAPVLPVPLQPEPVQPPPVQPATSHLPLPPASITTLALAAVGRELKDCNDCPTLVVLPAGRLRMGSPNDEKDRDADEGPVHEVRIDHLLAVGKYEVTRGDFARFVQASGYRTEAERGDGCAAWSGGTWERSVARTWRDPGFDQTESHPVVCVSWNDAEEYLRWLNERQPGKGYRLLSEAEWEYAARAGREGQRYPWGEDLGYNNICAFANVSNAMGKAQVTGVSGWAKTICSDGHAYTAPADAFKPNAFGLHNMHGNAFDTSLRSMI